MTQLTTISEQTSNSVTKDVYTSTGMPYSTDSLSSEAYTLETELFFEDRSARQVWGVLISLTAITSILGNVLLVVIIVINNQLRTMTNCFLVSLAFSDILIATMVMPFAAITSLLRGWVFGTNTCRFVAFTGVLSEAVTILSLVMVSVDRCIAVNWPLKYNIIMAPLTVGVMITAVWIQGVVFAFLPLAGWGSYSFLSEASVCMIDWKASAVYAITEGLLCKILPTLIIFAMFFMIIRAAHEQRRVFAIMPVPVGLTLAMGPAPTVNYRRTTMQAMRTLFIIVGALLALWIPGIIVQAAHLADEDTALSSDVFTMTVWFSFLSSTVNPLIFLTNKKFKQKLFELVQSLTAAAVPGYIHSEHTISTAVPSSAEPSLVGSSVSLRRPAQQKPTAKIILPDVKANTLGVPVMAGIPQTRPIRISVQTANAAAVAAKIRSTFLADKHKSTGIRSNAGQGDSGGKSNTDGEITIKCPPPHPPPLHYSPPVSKRLIVPATKVASPIHQPKRGWSNGRRNYQAQKTPRTSLDSSTDDDRQVPVEILVNRIFIREKEIKRSLGRTNSAGVLDTLTVPRIENTLNIHRPRKAAPLKCRNTIDVIEMPTPPGDNRNIQKRYTAPNFVIPAVFVTSHEFATTRNLRKKSETVRIAEEK